MSRKSYKDLENAIRQAADARAAIGQNRGYDKELAREAYEYFVGEELVPAMLAALDDACGDLDARTVERLANQIAKTIAKAT